MSGNQAAAQSPAEYAELIIVGFKKKASHNKNESLICFSVSMIGSLAAPLFVTLGADIANAICFAEIWIAKFLPALLSILVALSTAWIQLRKPQQLWSLYRTCQREAEDALTKYKFRVDQYKDEDQRDELLISKVAKIALDAHYSWLNVVPTPENLQTNSDRSSTAS